MSTTADPTHEILVGLDGSPSSLAALNWAARQAELTGSTLVVVTTWEWPSFGWDGAPLPQGYHRSDGARSIFEDALGKLREFHPSLVVGSLIAEGHPAPVLERASQAADLLVLGSRGHGEFSGMLLGSVSMHCTLHAHRPVAVVREPPSDDEAGMVEWRGGPESLGGSRLLPQGVLRCVLRLQVRPQLGDAVPIPTLLASPTTVRDYVLGIWPPSRPGSGRWRTSWAHGAPRRSRNWQDLRACPTNRVPHSSRGRTPGAHSCLDFYPGCRCRDAKSPD